MVYDSRKGIEKLEKSRVISRFTQERSFVRVTIISPPTVLDFLKISGLLPIIS